tara:strand:- start:40672 stop:42462 length:1791 start_codon:yes stop_codon:yes gene_type:complete
MRLLPILLLLTTAVVAQNRRAVPGRFVDPDGKPVANATVTAVWTSVAGTDFLPRDIVTTTTNASGRFRVELWPTLAYSVWAVGPARADGKRISTRSTRGFVGGVVNLEGRAIPTEIKVQYEGLQAWKDLGPFTVRGHLSRHGVGTFEMQLDDTATITLPPAPRDGVILELLDNEGRVWTSTKDWLREPLRKITIPPPLTVDAVVRDASGKPVAGARVLDEGVSEITAAPDGLLNRPSVRSWIEVGVSDESGKVHMQLPRANHPLERWRTSLLAATHADFAGAQAGQTMQNLRIDAVNEEAVKVLQFNLTALGPQIVRVHNNEQPLSGVRCAVAAQWGVQRDNRYQDFERQFYGMTDATGSCSFAAIPAKAGRRRLLLAIPNKDGAPTLLPTIDLVEDGPTDVDLAKLVTTNLVVRSASGTPALGAMVVTLPLDSAPPDEWVEPLHCDMGGRAVVRAFGRTLAFVFNGIEYGHKILDTGVGAATVELQLKPMLEMQIRIVDARGEPAEGAMMTMRSSMSARSSDAPGEKHIRHVVSQLNHWLRDRHRADTEGRIRLPFVPPPTLDYTIGAWLNDVGTSRAVPLEATTGELVLELKPR